jgi:Skp family chaperone for outer membrane proteins
MAEETAEAASESVTPEPEAKTFTQDQVNDLIAKEKGKIQSKFADYGDLKAAAAKLEEIETANASELEKAQKKAAEYEKQLAATQADLLRRDVLLEKGLDPKVSPLLTGSDRETLEAQADLILENTKPAAADFDGGIREPVEEPLTPEQEHNKLFLQAMGLVQE